mgnify:CR=1 FL=1
MGSSSFLSGLRVLTPSRLHDVGDLLNEKGCKLYDVEECSNFLLQLKKYLYSAKRILSASL